MVEKPKVLPAKGTALRTLMDAFVAAKKAGRPVPVDVRDTAERA